MATTPIATPALMNETSSTNREQFYHKNEGYDIREDVSATHDKLVALGLVEQALELEIKGLTVIPPEKVAPVDFMLRCRRAMLAAYERRNGIGLDYEQAETLEAAMHSGFGAHMAYMLLEDPAFSELLMNDAVLAMVDYRIGRNGTISSFQGLVKAKGGKPLALHTDELMVPPPYATHNGGINITYALTDYTIDNGAVLYVPGSHKYKRLPVGEEGWNLAVPVEAPAGSLIIWDGATWHGALPRNVSGLRLNLVMYFIRPHLRPMEVFFDRLSDAELNQHHPRYRAILGESLKFWWREEGPRFDSPDWAKIGSSAYC